MAEVTAFRNNATPYPLYGMPWVVVFPMLDEDGDPVTGLTCDSEVSLNGDTGVDCTNEAVEIPYTTATNKGMYYLILTAAEMTADIVAVTVYSGATTTQATCITLYPRKLVSIRAGTSAGGDTGYITLDANASANDDFYNGMICKATIDSNVEVRVITDYTGSNKQAAVTPSWNVAPDSDDTFVIYLPEGVQINQANVTHISGTAQTGRDLGTSVLLSAGTGTGQISLTSGAVLLQATQTGVTIPTVTAVTNGVTLADDAITAAKFDESTAFPVKSADTGATQIARVGADSDTLETLSDEIAAVKAETALILADTGTDGVVIASAQTVATVTDVTNAVKISAGTGAGQLDFTSGVVKSNLSQILGTALTETAGQIAAAFKKFFNVATPTGTVNSLPDAVAGANGGLPTTNGTKVTQTVDLTAGQSIAANGGTVATVTNLTNLPTMPNDWITAAGLKADAVTKIQNGLATPTNITAGTITTTTNLTNLPAITENWLTAAGVKADAVTKIQSGLATTTGLSGVALSAAGVDAILDEVVVGTYTMRQLLKLFGAKLHGTATGGGTTTITYAGMDETAGVIVETVDTSGNRSEVTLTV